MPERKPRLTVREEVYYQGVDQQPQCTPSVFESRLQTDFQPYGPRYLKATEQWAPLVDDNCWLAAASQLCIHNLEGRFLQTLPTEEQRLEAHSRVLEVAYRDNPEEAFLVAPLQSMRCSPAQLRQLRVRCQHGEARYLIYVVPR